MTDFTEEVARIIHFFQISGNVEIDGVNDIEKRTIQQNKALWRYFELLAEALNEAGYDMRKTLKPEIEIPWNKDMIRVHMWGPIMEAMTQKHSTTELEVTEIDKIYKVLDRHTASKLGIHLDFPSEEGR